MISLTPRQQDALRFIIGFKEAKGQSPSYVEIADGIGLSGESSKSQIHRLLGGLCERGAIRRKWCAERQIDVIEPLPIPRAPDGEPLHFVRIGGRAA
jgi:SOS-response transcriptional repressor LexA